MKKRQALCRGQHFDMSHIRELTGGSVRGCPAFVPVLVQCHRLSWVNITVHLCWTSAVPPDKHTHQQILEDFSKTICCFLWRKKKKKSRQTWRSGKLTSSSDCAVVVILQTLIITCVTGAAFKSHFTVHWPVSELCAVTLRTDTRPVRPASTLLNFPGLWWKTSLPAVANHTPADVTTGLH